MSFIDVGFYVQNIIFFLIYDSCEMEIFKFPEYFFVGSFLGLRMKIFARVWWDFPYYYYYYLLILLLIDEKFLKIFLKDTEVDVFFVHNLEISWIGVGLGGILES
jgi:hypothetical protein